jgi:hypothetical protein
MANERTGEGGTYLLDPETGERTLIKRPSSSTSSQEQTDGTANTQTPDSDRGGDDLRD